MNAKASIKRFGKMFTPAYLTKIAVLTAISFIMYMYIKIPLAFIFPSFLEFQFSELPAMLGGFALGPFAGALITVLKCVLKLPFTGTAFVGELTDMLLGLLYVCPAAIFYHYRKTRKSALFGLLIGTACSTAGAILINRFISVPFYVEFFFHGNFNIIVNIVKPLYKNVNSNNFYAIYLSAGVLPFNLLRLGVVSLLTFLMYKHLSGILHWEIKSKKQEEKPMQQELQAPSEQDEVLMLEEMEENELDKNTFPQE
ncbi:MAG TPA: ECF transporter S component [Clostridiales bacterium]|nr:ECF transporter S component [Clostridiales bacterium]